MEKKISLAAGEKLELTETVRLELLSLEVESEVTAPSGKCVTLTVDGIHTQMEPGTYKGDVVLSVTDAIHVERDNYGNIESVEMNAAVSVVDGKYIPDQSVAAAVTSGSVSDGQADGVRIRSCGDNFGGIYVGGDREYVINDADIELVGNGASDAMGYGAGIAVRGNAKVTINRAKISNTGSIRTAVMAFDHGSVIVNDSILSARDGNKPNYVFAMTKAPWMLGIHGRVRTTNIQDYGSVTYNRCKISAENWGVMSTDGTRVVRLDLNDCHVWTENCGYGAYSIGDCKERFSGCTIDVHDYAVIMCSGGAAEYTNNTVVNSKRNGVMMHGGGAPGKLRIDKGSEFNTQEEVFLTKSCGTDIEVEGASLKSDNGIILLSMVNDDLNSRGVEMGPETVMEPPPGGFQMPAPPPPQEHDSPPDGDEAPHMHGKPDESVFPVYATFKDMTLNGDFYHGTSAMNNMQLTFDNTSLSGAAATCVTFHPHRMPDCAEQYRLVGRVDTYPCPNDNDFGVHIKLINGAIWEVTETSYLRTLEVGTGCEVRGAKMTVDGVYVKINEGLYQGRIVLSV